MLNIDSPYNHKRRRKESTSNYNPRIIVNTNFPIPGDDTYFMFWKEKKRTIIGKNKVPVK